MPDQKQSTLNVPLTDVHCEASIEMNGRRHFHIAIDRSLHPEIALTRYGSSDNDIARIQPEHSAYCDLMYNKVGELIAITVMEVAMNTKVR